jgi:hypothetical protein
MQVSYESYSIHQTADERLPDRTAQGSPVRDQQEEPEDEAAAGVKAWRVLKA